MTPSIAQDVNSNNSSRQGGRPNEREFCQLPGIHIEPSKDYDRPFGCEDYGKEELIAELGSAFLCAEAGIDNSELDNSAAYIQSWLKVLKNDKRLIISASSHAMRATRYILGQTEEE